MAGGLSQLIVYGAQDVFLTGTPQITYFKAKYLRHTHFAVEAIEQPFTGNPDFGRRVQATLARSGDLVGRVYLVTSLPAVTAAAATVSSGFSWVKELGHHIIRSVQYDIGSQIIDKHYGEWLSIWASLTLPAGQAVGYANMIGNVAALTGTIGGAHAVLADAVMPAKRLYTPLQFSWNRLSGLYLPVIALQYHDIKITVEFKTFNECHRGAATAVPQFADCSLLVDYLFLERDERTKFAQHPHEYLTEQVQFNSEESLTASSSTIRLNLNHPCKEFYWFVRRDDAHDSASYASRLLQDHTNYTTVATSAAGVNPIATALIRFNGNDRFAPRDGDYFRYVQKYQYHSNTGAEGLNSFSFALTPEEHQPSGTVNMSRIDTATLNITTVAAMAGVPAKISVYAFSYNVVRINGGMGGLAFSN